MGIENVTDRAISQPARSLRLQKLGFIRLTNKCAELEPLRTSGGAEWARPVATVTQRYLRRVESSIEPS